MCALYYIVAALSITFYEDNIMIAGKQFAGFHLAEEVREQLVEIAKANRRSRSQVVELLIEQEYRRLSKNSKARLSV